MKKVKKFTLNKLLVCLLAPLMCAALAFGLSISDKNAGAMTSYPYSPTLSKELFNYDTYSYNKDALDDLARAILNKQGDSNTTISTLISNIKGTAKTHGKPVSDKNITVAYGRYGLTTGTEASQLVWMPVYMSTSRSGEAVLTLYLAATGGPRSGQEKDGFTSLDLRAGVAGQGQYTDQINCGAPSNMYGVSYIRSVTLGNASRYMSYDQNHSATYTENRGTTLQATSSHKYLDFQRYNEVSDGETIASMGYLYDDLVTPSEMLWQSYESYAEFIGESGVIKNGKGDGVEGGGADWANYCFPNEAYDAPRSYTKTEGTVNKTYSPEYNNTNFDYKNKTQYGDWQNDKVWLPSLTEVGTGDYDGASVNTLNGLWQLTDYQRGNPNKAGASWLRTANTVYNMDGKGWSTYSMFCCEEDGTIGTHSLKETDIAVRPAIHLNLDKALKKTNPPVALPETVVTTYIGQEIAISDTLNNVPSSEKWYVNGKMHVNFFSTVDCNLQDELAPLNAGTYYMKVTLHTADLYFAKAPVTQTDKVVKFVVEKARLGVKWSYTNNRATDLKLTEGKVYDWDKKIGMEPEIGIRYESSTGQGTIFYEYDELLRDTYFGYGYIKDSDKYKYNYELYDVDNPDLVDSKTGKPIVKSDSFAVGRKVLKMPYFYGYEEGVEEIQLMYASDQYVQLVGASKYFSITVNSAHGKGEATELGVSDEGYLTYRISELDTYTFTIRFENNDQFTWYGSAYDFDKNNNDTGADWTEKQLVVSIVPAKVDVDYVNLPAEWNTITNVTFSLDVRGIYGLTSSDIVRMNVYYENSGGRKTYLTAEADGTYKLNSIPAGEYTMYATLADPKYVNNYYMDPSYKLQRFKVVQTVSNLGDNDIKWHYTHDGITSASFGFADHDTEENALELNFDDKHYVFALTMDATELRERYYVKAEYDGDFFVKNAGMHSVTVSITAFNKNVQFEDKEYKVYFYIKPLKFDLSDLEWNYDMTNPPVYNGATKKIQLTADSLANYAGLTAKYECDGDATGAGSYKTTVSFILSGDYAINCVLPESTDLDSYDGEFAFTCDWIIAKAKLAVEWNEPVDDGSSGLLFVPTLKVGGEYVDYVYEHKEADGSWTPTETLTAEGAAETYRVKAVIKAAYANNYELENDSPREFEVASGKHPVVIHFEHNGETVADGAEFSYTGLPVSLTLVVDGVGLSVKEYSFKYYSLDGGRTELSGAPTEVGAYAAVVTAKFGTDTYVSNESSTEIQFSIVKADFDLSQIYWIYEHGNKIVAATYDTEQGKWVDEQGREVIFSFEYDGTPHSLKVSCLEKFNSEDDYLGVASLRGNSATDAGSSDYTALVTFDYNEKHFNSPLSSGFPAQLTWSVTKKQINYSEVRWGYIDTDGKERDFDFANDSFTFTRDENGVVGFTVQLIGLPEGVQNLISYKTQDLSVKDGPTTDGNTRSAIGEYLTSFTISGTWSDPNYVDFDSKDFPNIIPTLCNWQITRRNLSKIDYKDGFAKFDDRAHNVIELCNIPEDELYYITIDITFVDSTEKNVYNNYPGYNDEKNMIYHAGTYDVRVYELVGEDEIPVVWDFVRIIVAKNELHVYWDLNGSYPIARVKSIYATDMVGTRYFNTNDAEVPLAYVRSTKGEDFYATACVTEAYEKDIDIVLEGDEKVNFTYHPYDPADFDGDPTVLAYPTIVEENIEYTGEKIKFQIDAWDTYYSKYLYISDGDLEQVAEGEYHVLLSFKKDANAYWLEPVEDEDYNRNSYLLTFYIDPPTRWGLEYPNIDNKRVDWTGSTLEFKVTNWVALSKYVDYTVMYDGVNIGDQTTFRNGVFTFKDGGVYTIYFTIPDSSIGYWINNPDADRAPYSVQISIIGDPDHPAELTDPVLNRTSAKYTGSALEFRVNDWGAYSEHVDVEYGAGVTFSNGVITAINVGTYEIKFKIKENSTLTFVKSDTDKGLTRTLTFRIEPDEAVEAKLNYPVLNENKAEATGSELSFYVRDWTAIYSNYLTVSCSSEAVKIEGGTIRVTVAGKYEIVVSFKDGVNAVWAETEGKEDYTLNLEITPKAETENGTYRPKPEDFAVSEKPYNGKDQTFVLTYNADKVEIVEGIDYLTQKEVGDYTITLRPKAGFVWLDENGNELTGDDATKEVTLTFKITKAQIGDVNIGDDGKPVVTDKDGKPLPDFDFGDLVDIKYFDKDGNEVKYEDLVPGEKYTVKIIVKDDAKFDASIDGGSSIRDIINDKNDKGSNGEDGGFVIPSYKPSEKPDDGNGDDPKDGGFNPLWWIAIGGGVLAVIAIIGVIIGLATRRNGGDGGYDDDYGDDYDDDYDDDDYDDYDDDDYDDYDDEY